VEEGRLHLADVPLHARYPIEVKVVAYQLGRCGPDAPPLAPARAVQAFQILHAPAD
jgi:hypothetical protein